MEENAFLGVSRCCLLWRRGEEEGERQQNTVFGWIGGRWKCCHGGPHPSVVWPFQLFTHDRDRTLQPQGPSAVYSVGKLGKRLHSRMVMTMLLHYGYLALNRCLLTQEGASTDIDSHV